MIFSKGIAAGFQSIGKTFCLVLVAGIIAAAPQVFAQQGSPVAVRHAEHPTFSRVVFDFPEEIPYQATKRGTVLTVTFEHLFQPELGALQSAPMRDIFSPATTRSGTDTVVTFQVNEAGFLRHFRSGTFVVIDMMTTAPVATGSSGIQTSPVGGAQANAGQTNSDQGDEPSGTPPSSGQETPQVMTEAEDNDPPPVILGVVDDSQPLDVIMTGTRSRMKLTFPWAENVGAAAFIRNGFLWIIFDGQRRFDPSGLSSDPVLYRRWIRSVETTASPGATIIRMGVGPGLSTIFERFENAWVLTLQNRNAEPRFPLQPIKRIEKAEGQQIFVPTTSGRRQVSIEDPVLGETMVVLPLRNEGRGLAEVHRYALAELLESSQGLVVLPLSDDVRVETFQEGVSISNLDPSVLAADPTGGGGGFTRLIDFRAWRIGTKNEYRKIKARLYYELSLKERAEVNDARWKIARYFISHRRPQEALGMLARMVEDEPTLLENGEFRVVRGVANTLARRFDEAEDDFSHPDLLISPDVDLWRLLVAEAKENYADALTYYDRGSDILAAYEDFEKAEIQLAVVRAAIAEDALVLADRELQFLKGIELTEDQLLETVYHAARIARLRGDELIAKAQFESLGASSNREIAALARYTSLKDQIDKGEMSVPLAIEALERLRYAWRGGEFELNILEDLSELYFSIDDYENGLGALKLAVTHYPIGAKERRMASTMVGVFRRLYLDGDADALDPIKAITLFRKFSELTPLGNDGDMMVRRLADRLVAVDLLGEAAELLLYQVKERTEGSGQALIASNLAKLYILDERPEQAMQILRATRMPQLPEDVQDQRRWVEARTLMELQRYEEAEVLLEPDLSREAEALRADIYWSLKNWSLVVASNTKLLGDGWRQAETLDAMQRLYLLRMAIAMTFDEDRDGLIQLRTRYMEQMRTGEFAKAFDLLTSDQILTGSELGAIARQIASVEKLQNFMSDYRNDFSSNSSGP